MIRMILGNRGGPELVESRLSPAGFRQVQGRFRAWSEIAAPGANQTDIHRRPRQQKEPYQPPAQCPRTPNLGGKARRAAQEWMRLHWIHTEHKYTVSPWPQKTHVSSINRWKITSIWAAFTVAEYNSQFFIRTLNRLFVREVTSIFYNKTDTLFLKSHEIKIDPVYFVCTHCLSWGEQFICANPQKYFHF